MNSQTPQTFKGPTLDHAKQAALTALGRDAVIIATREIKERTLLGLVTRPSYEVAALPPEPVSKKPEARAPFAASVYSEPPRALPQGRDEVAALRSELRREVRSLRAALTTRESSAQTGAPIVEELAAMRSLLEDLGDKKGKTSKVQALVRELGIEGAAAAAITRAAKGLDGEALQEAFARTLRAHVRVTPWPIADKVKTAIALVGPTGVGKTTTGAKLAAHALKSRKTVHFIACDGYRVGAIDQLRRFADALRVKLTVAASRAAVEAAVLAAREDVVIVDTAGQGPRAPEGPEAAIASLGIEAGRARHVLLCMSASVRSVDVERIARTFGRTKPTALTVTKIDETDVPSGVIHGAWATRLPVSILCDGQRVPEDIAPADLDRIVSMFSTATQKST